MRCPQNECHLRAPRVNTNSRVEMGRASLLRTAGEAVILLGRGQRNRGEGVAFSLERSATFSLLGGTVSQQPSPAKGKTWEITEDHQQAARSRAKKPPAPQGPVCESQCCQWLFVLPARWWEAQNVNHLPVLEMLTQGTPFNPPYPLNQRLFLFHSMVKFWRAGVFLYH